MTPFMRNLALCLAAGFMSISVAATATAVPVAGRAGESDTYAMSDFASVPKYDAHVHANSKDIAFLEQARADGFELMSINVDYPDFPSLALQHDAALALAKADPVRFHWATTFSMQGFGTPDWSDRVNAGLARDAAQGARAVKIWKNVGMIEKDADGRLIMLDAPALSPVAEQVAALGVALIGHQGEPHNCWL
ncbi:MAG TPA: amidohydrolase, partial [Pseudoxanthomonas sp.]|nr:amidohydrolase [Pseudoxanthomonas sp.]